jgi:peroxiredoxin
VGNEPPHPLIRRLTGLTAPTVVLPWTTYSDLGEELGSAATTSLARLARRRTLVVYFTPGEDEGDGPSADTMSRAFRAHDHGIGQLGAMTVGVSTQTALEQQRVATAEEFPQMMLADDQLRLADDLDLPTIEGDGRVEYQCLTLIIHEGRIAHIIYPIELPGHHLDQVLYWLAHRNTRKPAARPRPTPGKRHRR